MLAVKPREKLVEIISCRLTDSNWKYLQKIKSKNPNVSTSDVINQLMDQFRHIENDSYRGKPRRGN